MAELTVKQANAVRRIIISYPAWIEFREKSLESPDNREWRDRMSLWAHMLAEDQETLGVMVCSPELLDANKNKFLYSYLDKSNKIMHTDNRYEALGTM